MVLVLTLLAGCGGNEGYPRLSDVPERPDPTLTPERSEEVTQELEAARDEAVSHATEGRPLPAEGEGEDE